MNFHVKAFSIWFCFLIFSISFAEEALYFDFATFKQMRIEEIKSSQEKGGIKSDFVFMPPTKYMSVLKTNLKIREISKSILKDLTNSFKANGADLDLLKLYQKEMMFEHSRGTVWLPIQNSVLESFQKNKDSSERSVFATLYHFGFSKKNGHLYVLIHVDEKDVPVVESAPCFNDALHGIKLGDPYQKSLEKLSSKYKRAGKDLKREDYTYDVFHFKQGENIMELVLGRIGGSKKVDVIQFSDKEKSSEKVDQKVRFGMRRRDVYLKYGLPMKETQIRENTILSLYKNNGCSIEYVDGELRSVRIEK